jgi:hypothetical protein
LQLAHACAPSRWNGALKHRARLLQFHEQHYEQLHNFNSQTTNSLVSFSENSLSQS